MKGMRLDKSRQNRAGYCKRRILVMQENCKLFTVLFGALSVIMLVIDIVNACTGSFALWLAILLNAVWALCAVGYCAYVLTSAVRRRRWFERLGRIVYGEGGYRRCIVEQAPAPLAAGGAVRLYEREGGFALAADGLDGCGRAFWTRFDFSKDFGLLLLDGSAVRKEEEGGRIVFRSDDTIILREEG